MKNNAATTALTPSPDLRTRRAFLGQVGRGMIAASVGVSLADELGFSTAFAEEGAAPGGLTFGRLDPLVGLMRDTPADKLLPLLVGKLRGGEAGLKDLIAAGALANARTFGGEDYAGFHCMFALVPALEMAEEMPERAGPLPVLKVLYRNTARMQRRRRQEPDTLQPVEPAELPPGANAAEMLRQATRTRETLQGDRIVAALAGRSSKEAFEALQLVVQDKPNVHGVALAHRAWEVLDLVGHEHAHMLLRQSVHFCTGHQNDFTHGGTDPELQALLGRHLDKLAGKAPGDGAADDAWVAEMARTIYHSSRSDAADAVAEALAGGVSPEVVGEAISLSANEIVLRQDGDRTHGDSRGVHASDAVNAWRNIARVTDLRNRYASLIVAAYHVGAAGRKVITGAGSRFSQDEDPFALFAGRSGQTDLAKLLGEAEEAIRANDQVRAGAAVLRYSQLEGAAPRPVFDLLLKYAVSEDGRLHAEKYYRTVTEEFATIRPAYRWRQLVALSRVTASCYGMARNDKKAGRAPGYLQARELLGLG